MYKRELMRQLEEPVKKTLEELKAKHRHHLALKERYDGYYVFETMPKWDEKLQRTTFLSFYVGKIEKDGRFVEPVRKRNSTRNAKDLDEYIAQRERAELKDEKEAFESEYEPLILKELSTNPRDGIAAISKRLGLPYSTTLYWVRKLEKKYGIRYTIEPLFLNRFGLFRFLAVAKFINKRPNAEELKKLFGKNPYVQAAFMSKGAFDLFIFFLAPDPAVAEDFIYEIRSDKALASFPANWYSSYYTQGVGYIPLRDELFEVLKTRIWTRSKEQPRKRPNQIFLREYATLKELNDNGMIEFSEIDNKYQLKSGSAQYTYHKLLEDRMMLRITIAMEKPPITGTAVFIAEQLNVERFNRNKEAHFREATADEGKPLNKYVFLGDIGAPYGVILIAPLYSSPEFELIEQRLWKTISGARIKASIMTTMLVGRLSYRNMYPENTLVYRMLTTEHWAENPDNVALRKLE